MNNLIDKARCIPCGEPTPTISINPITLAAPGRGRDLEMRLTLPAQGARFPVLLLSHGHGASLYIASKDGYGPLANFYAARGFAVIQPTHLNSRVGGAGPSHPEAPLFWKSRVEDMVLILDHLEEIGARLDPNKVAIIGHSMGGHTAGLLLGATPPDQKQRRDSRIQAGVLLAAPGRGGESLSAYAAEHYPFLGLDYGSMVTPTLVVAGDADESAHLSVRGPAWHTDPYHDGPGRKSLLTLAGGKHGLGGVSGFDAKETDDEDPDRLATTQSMTWAYLRSTLYPQDSSWRQACDSLPESLATVAEKDG